MKEKGSSKTSTPHSKVQHTSKQPVKGKSSLPPLNKKTGPTAPSTIQTSESNSHILTSTQVTSYLKSHPKFLESFVVTHISNETLSEWMRMRNSSNNSKMISRNKPSQALEVMKDSSRQVVADFMAILGNFGNFKDLLQNICSKISEAINADDFLVFDVDSLSKTISVRFDGALKTYDFGYKSVPAALAAESLKVLTIPQDKLMFYADLPKLAKNFKELSSVMCCPLLGGNDQMDAVVQFHRHKHKSQFGTAEQETLEKYLSWAKMLISFFQTNHDLSVQRKLNEFLLEVTNLIFNDVTSMEAIIKQIMKNAQELVSADRASLFLVDYQSDELYARLFDGGHDNETSPSEIRFPMTCGIAGRVARTGETQNIKNVYNHQHFNSEVDKRTGYVTRNLLCMPIMNKNKIIGVVEMINKLPENEQGFTKEDETAFKLFSVFCGLALHHARLYDRLYKSEHKLKVALEVLSYHGVASDHDVKCLVNTFYSMKPNNGVYTIADYKFDPWNFSEEFKPLYVLFMFHDICSFERFDIETLARFTLTVKKNYRIVPYHNWQHGFSVAHTVYCILKTNPGIFSELEIIAMFVACLCHDLDHRGFTNQFMQKTATPLAAIYSTSIMENHHFNQTITILQHEGHNIFQNLDLAEYKKVLHYVRKAIIATDLAEYFKNKGKLMTIMENEKVDLTNELHREYVKCLAMTASDLNNNFKPWETLMSTVDLVFEEFYKQGDKEKILGDTPISMMDRDFAHELPANQVGFVSGICVPCAELLSKFLPGAKVMHETAQDNLKKWKTVMHDREKSCTLKLEVEQRKKFERELTNTDLEELPKPEFKLNDDEN